MTLGFLFPKPAGFFSLGAQISRSETPISMLFLKPELVYLISSFTGRLSKIFPFQVLEYLIVRLQYRKEEQLDEFIALRGTLVVSVAIEELVLPVNQTRCTTVSECHHILPSGGLL